MGEARREADKGGGAADVAVRPPRPGPGAPPPPRSRRASPSPLCGRPGRGGEGAAAAAPRRPEWGQPAARRGHPRHPHPRHPSGAIRQPLTPTVPCFPSAALASLIPGRSPPPGVSVPVPWALEMRLAPRKPIILLPLSAAPPVSSPRQGWRGGVNLFPSFASPHPVRAVCFVRGVLRPRGRAAFPAEAVSLLTLPGPPPLLARTRGVSSCRRPSGKREVSCVLRAAPFSISLAKARVPVALA